MTSIIILLGAPGSGKGTVSQFLTNNYSVCHFSTGNLLRDEVQKESDIGLKIKDILSSGSLVDDDVVNELVEQRIEKAFNDVDAVILDGYPRTRAQAIKLDEMRDGSLKSLIHVIELVVCEEEVVERISKRQVCSVCGKTYGPNERICSCGGNLIKRKDDEESVVRRRLEQYRAETLPVSEYYSDRLIRVPGEGTPIEVARKVSDVLRSFGIEKRR